MDKEKEIEEMANNMPIILSVQGRDVTMQRGISED